LHAVAAYNIDCLPGATQRELKAGKKGGIKHERCK
jgi:hypothetical protein